MVNAREGALKRYHFVGNPLQFDPEDYVDQGAVRKRLGYGPERLLICSSGGTAVGHELLRLCIDAYPLMKEGLPDLRMLVVKGPRMTADLGPVPPGVDVLGYVPRLYEHFAAANMAIVQGGGGSTLELAALRRPFLYFPFKGHSEQEVNVANKLERQGLGVKCSFDRTSLKKLTSLVVENIDRPLSAPVISYKGCREAARIIAGTLGDRSTA